MRLWGIAVDQCVHASEISQFPPCLPVMSVRKMWAGFTRVCIVCTFVTLLSWACPSMIGENRYHRWPSLRSDHPFPFALCKLSGIMWGRLQPKWIRRGSTTRSLLTISLSPPKTACMLCILLVWVSVCCGKSDKDYEENLVEQADRWIEHL